MRQIFICIFICVYIDLNSPILKNVISHHIYWYLRGINKYAAAAKSLQLCPTLCDPKTAAHQAPPSMGFSRQEYWSGLPFPSPMRESEKWKWSRSVVLTLSDPMDGSLPGSSVHGIFQARALEWGATPVVQCSTICYTVRKKILAAFLNRLLDLQVQRV